MSTWILIRAVYRRPPCYGSETKNLMRNVNQPGTMNTGRLGRLSPFPAWNKTRCLLWCKILTLKFVGRVLGYSPFNFCGWQYLVKWLRTWAYPVSDPCKSGQGGASQFFRMGNPCAPSPHAVFWQLHPTFCHVLQDFQVVRQLPSPVGYAHGWEAEFWRVISPT